MEAMDESRMPSIFASLSKLFLDDKFSDMTITCNGQQFNAHRAIVCTQSAFFDKALKGGFKEAETGTIDLPDDDPDVVKAFLQFLYTGSYDDGLSPPRNGPSAAAKKSVEHVTELLSQPLGAINPSYGDASDGEHDSFSEAGEIPGGESKHGRLIGSEGDPEIYTAKQLDDIADLQYENSTYLALRLYVIADKFDVLPLRLLAYERFYRALEARWKRMECFPDTIDELYCSTFEKDATIRDGVCGLVARSIKDSGVREKLAPVMQKHGDFAFAVLERSMQDSESALEHSMQRSERGKARKKCAAKYWGSRTRYGSTKTRGLPLAAALLLQKRS